MFNPHRTRLLANISKYFTDQGLEPPDPSLFKWPKGAKKAGKPLPTRLIRKMSRGLGLIMSEQEARLLLQKEKTDV